MTKDHTEYISCTIPAGAHFSASASHHCDHIIAGGGLAAFFAAYELLRQARDSGRKINVTVLADKISVPCTAGSHAVLELEGLFHDDVPQRKEISALLRGGLTSLENTIRRENIDCRYHKGYEIKGRTAAELEDAIDDMVAKGIYTRDEILGASSPEVFHLPGYDHSVSVDKIGQVNMPGLLRGLIARIETMGGKVLTGLRYEGQTQVPDGTYMVHTNHGSFHTHSKPLLATGAEHLQELPYFPFEAKTVYSMGIVMGPLSPEDAAKISSGPMAFCDTDLDGDVLWGGLDGKNYFTIGRGDIDDPRDEEKLRDDIMRQVEKLYPGLAAKYQPHVSFGAMLVPENRMPTVGRLLDYDVMGGWAGMGIVAGYAAAKAYARWALGGDDADLKIFENMQPNAFALDIFIQALNRLRPLSEVTARYILPLETAPVSVTPTFHING